jgi:predicted negative regulator of RcsB-dependent stress response
MASIALPPDTPLAAQIEWIRKNSRIVTLAAAVVVAGVLGVFLYLRSAQIRSERAEAAYGEAQQLLYSGNREAGATRLEEVATRYAGTASGSVAALRLAQLRLEDNKPGDAIRVLQSNLSKSDSRIFGSQFHSLIGAAWSDSGQFDKAAAAFTQAAESARLDNEREEYTFRSALMYAQAGNKARALEILNRLASGDPSEIRARARRLAGEIGAEAAKAGG